MAPVSSAHPPVVLGHAVLDRHDRVRRDEPTPVLHHLVAVEDLVLPGEVVTPVAVQLARRRVKRDGDVIARVEAGGLDRLDQDADGVFVGGEVRCETALVADCRREPTVVEHPLQHVIGLGPHRIASDQLGAPIGITMNSWRSIELSACTPPLTTFIIGTGSTCALTPPT